MPTSATGTERARRRARPPRAAAVGFTLLELIVVLAIASLLAGLAGFAWPRYHENMQYREAVRGVFGGLLAARSDAMRNGRPARFFIDLSSRSYGIDGAVRGHLPENLAVRLIVAGREIGTSDSGAIAFYEDGASTGGTVEVERASASGVRIRVDWLLGSIAQEAL